MRIDFLGLEAFLYIAETGSFQQAAHKLNLTQTALTHRMRKLEEGLGLQLLVRGARRISLTPAGIDLLPKARRMMNELSQSLETLREEGRRNQLRLSIGCMPTIANTYLPAVLARFAQSHPDVQVSVLDRSADEITQSVSRGEAIFGITLTSSTIWDLEAQTLLRDPFVLLCPADHRFATRRDLSWSDLKDETLIRMGAGSGIRTLIDTSLGGRRETLHWRHEALTIDTAIALAAHGLGLVVVPRLRVSDGRMPPNMVSIPLGNPTVTRPLGIVQKRGAPLSGAGAALLDLIVSDLFG
jgi:DNA-binding transcriptional LysR family regulator